MKKKYFVLLVCLMLCSFLSSTTRAQNSTSLSISAQGSINYPSPNLAVIPDDFSLTFGSAPQYAYVDYSVTHNGHVSIRVEPDYVVGTREVDGTWYSVKPGDHIVFKVWVKTGASGLNPDPSSTAGGRIGMDYYGHTSAGYGILFKTASADSDAGVPGWYGNAPGAIGSWWVPWGKDWTMIGWDVIIPSDFYPYVNHNGMKPCTPVQIDSFVPILDVRSSSNAGQVWFCDGEIYINPNFASTAPQPLPQNVQIAVSSVAASSYSYGHPPGLAVDGIESPYNYWGTNAGVPEGRVPQWLKLDLGSVHRINTVTTHFYDGSVRTYTYYIQVSNDSSSWTTIVSTKTGSGSVTDTFSQVGARFVRITITANTANPAAHIEEIKVYGFS